MAASLLTLDGAWNLVVYCDSRVYNYDIGVARWTPCFVPVLRTMIRSSTPRWSILKTLTVCLQIMFPLAMGQSHYAHSESGNWIIYTFRWLLTDPTYATSSSIQIKTFMSNMALAFVIVETTISSCFLVAYECKCFASNTIPIVDQIVAH